MAKCTTRKTRLQPRRPTSNWQRWRRLCPVQSTEVAGVEYDTVRCTVYRVDHSSAVRPYCPPDVQSTYCPRRIYTWREIALKHSLEVAPTTLLQMLLICGFYFTCAFLQLPELTFTFSGKIDTYVPLIYELGLNSVTLNNHLAKYR